MNKRCGNCKYLGLTHEIVSRKVSKNSILHYHVGVEENEWCGVEEKFYPCLRYFHDAASAKAVPVDGSGYFAAICVREDFGCVDWEERDTSEGAP